MSGLCECGLAKEATSVPYQPANLSGIGPKSLDPPTPQIFWRGSNMVRRNNFRSQTMFILQEYLTCVKWDQTRPENNLSKTLETICCRAAAWVACIRQATKQKACLEVAICRMNSRPGLSLKDSPCTAAWYCISREACRWSVVLIRFLGVSLCLNMEGASCVRIVLKLIGDKDCNYMTSVTLDTLFPFALFSLRSSRLFYRT